MNKILVSRDRIISNFDKINVDGKNISIFDSGTYFLEYDNIDQIELCVFVIGNINVELFESAFLKDIKVNNKYIVDGSLLTINKFYNNDSVMEEVNIDLFNGGKIDYKFSNICKNKESYIININHLGIGTVSNISNKSIAMNLSKLDFVINSIVGKEYEKSVLDQNTRIVTLGESDAKISPNMYIDCDDIEARHGSVIGTFKDEMVFYLMSRGIEYNEAIKLLIKGYLFSNINADNSLREKIRNVIDMYWG